MSIAAGALVAQAIGAGDDELARQRSTTSLIFGVLFSVIFSALVWFNIPYLAGLMGAKGEALYLTTNYLRIIIPSLPLLVVGMIGSAILRSYGDAQRSMFATVAGGVVNAVLDPILIFGLQMELSGAAWASVAARFAIGFMALLPILRHHGGFIRPDLAHIMQDIRPLAIIAFPAILTQLATPIIGQNFAAKQYGRVAGAYRENIIFTAVVVVLMSMLLFLLRGPIADLFGAQGVTRELVFLFLGPLALLFFFNGQIFVSNAAFNILGHPYYPTWVNWGRSTLGAIPFVFVFAIWLGAPGALIGQALGGVAFGIIAWVLARRVIAQAQESGGDKPKAFHSHTRLHKLFHHRH